MSNEENQPGDGNTGDEAGKEQVFTQADVDRIVKKKADELYRRRVGDVDIEALKAKATGVATAEERIAALERQITEANTSALRARIANQFGVPAEDADLFLTGTDEDTLTKQAQRLAARDSDRKKQGNFVPREGNNPRPAENELREFTRNLFAKQD